MTKSNRSKRQQEGHWERAVILAFVTSKAENSLQFVACQAEGQDLAGKSFCKSGLKFEEYNQSKPLD